MSIEFRDKMGKPISRLEFYTLFEDLSYRSVAATQLDGVWISTVWLGFLCGARDEFAFETMVFLRDTAQDEVDSCRYLTLQEAEQGHQAMVEKWKANPVASAAARLGAPQPFDLQPVGRHDKAEG